MKIIKIFGAILGFFVASTYIFLGFYSHNFSLIVFDTVLGIVFGVLIYIIGELTSNIGELTSKGIGEKNETK